MHQQRHRGGHRRRGVDGAIDPSPARAEARQADDLRGIAADDRRSVAQQFNGDLAAPRQAASADRVEHPGPPGGARRGGGEPHTLDLRRRRRTEIDQHGIRNAGEEAGLLRVVDHRRSGAHREQHIRHEIGRDGIRQALDERRLRPQRVLRRHDILKPRRMIQRHNPSLKAISRHL